MHLSDQKRDLYIRCIAIFESEAHSPLIVDADTLQPFAVIRDPRDEIIIP